MSRRSWIQSASIMKKLVFVFSVVISTFLIGCGGGGDGGDLFGSLAVNRVVNSPKLKTI